jgi:acyl-CoA reductase-like NAD-dependent aldehyde dehydrogenase
MELSGCDAMFVLEGADLALVADSIAYGLSLNGGATCIAPRRVFVDRAREAALNAALRDRITRIPPAIVPPAARKNLDDVLADAEEGGARVFGHRDGAAIGPILVTVASPELRIARADLFAPVTTVFAIDDIEAALAADALCPYALGASIFGSPETARAVAARVRAGSVVINDIIVPTADPRLPFGGRGRSGFGVTRGAEGLLEMTVIKTVSERRLRFRPHLRAARAGDAARFAALIALLHTPGIPRWRTIRGLLSPLGK